MTSSAPTAGSKPTPEPRARDDAAVQPTSLSDLITYVMERDGYSKLMPMAKKGRTSYKTLYAWWTGQRGAGSGRGRGGGRAITEESLRIFAEDYNLPLPLVLHAAGRATEPLEFGDEELQVLHLYKELTPEDRELAEQMMRTLADRAERARSQKVTRG